MRFALPLLIVILISAVIVLSHRAAAPVNDEPDLSLPVYGACQNDDECTLLSLPCGAVAAARADRRTELQHYYNDVKARMRCARIEEPRMQRAVCAESRCRAHPQDPQGEEE